MSRKRSNRDYPSESSRSKRSRYESDHYRDDDRDHRDHRDRDRYYDRDHRDHDRSRHSSRYESRHDDDYHHRSSRRDRDSRSYERSDRDRKKTPDKETPEPKPAPVTKAEPPTETPPAPVPAKDKEEEDRKQQERKERLAKWREEVVKKKLKEKEEAEAKEKAEAEAAAAAAAKEKEAEEQKAAEQPPSEASAAPTEEEDDIDPLEAYMQTLAKTPIPAPRTDASRNKSNKGRADLNLDSDDDDDFQVVDEDEEWRQKIRKRELQKVDHSTIQYQPFRKNFYIEVPEIANMTADELREFRESLGNIEIRGKKCPRPIRGFHQCGLSDRILDCLRKFAYENPTPIQAQAIPAIMSGRDVIGIAKTGSGKTLAFLLPMLRHILDQPLPVQGEGPIGIIMAPTRELAVQIHTELRRFTKRLGIKSVCIFGGSGISHQIGDLKRGAAVAVCTPGRMIDILCTNAGRVTNLQRVTYLVLDEADRMFDMGFEPQIMRIIDNIRPDRQTVMFSATFPRQVEAVARKILKRPIIEIVVGGVSVVCSDVEQIVEVRSSESRFTRLLQLLGEWSERGSILVFVNQQEECDQIFRKLTQAGYNCGTLHGGKDQMDRASTIADFKSEDVKVMVATSVAARGLDVPSLRLVVNYTVPNHYEDYVHRCGRTGRAGRQGTAITFITEEEEQFAPDLEKALRLSKTAIPEDLAQLVQSYQDKVKSGSAHKHGSGFGGSGYKFDEAEAQAKKREMTLQRRAYLGDEADDDMDDMDEETPQDSSTTPAATNNTPTPANTTTDAKPKDGLDSILRNIVKPAVSTPVTPLVSDGLEAEVEINEYPQNARWKVTHKDALAAITEFTGCVITTRGTYVAPGRPTPAGERKLYLYIEGPDPSSVYNATHEIKRILREAATNAFPDREQYGKYSI